jgi:aromatic ring hydroxylase
MRTGAEYRRALRDGRRVWVMGEGIIEDVTTHPATRATVDEYVAWYDLLRDPASRETALRPADGTPWAYVVPRSADDLAGMGRFFSATTFLSAGNITHTPSYGHMIALGVLASTEEYNVSAEQIANASRYRAMIAETGRFLTFCGGAPTIGSRLRPDPAERAALKIVRETDAGIVVKGKIGMHTSPAYAEDVYVGSISGMKLGEHFVTFIVPIAAPGVTTLCRKIAVRDQNPFVAPLSSRFDELDGQMWLDDVFIPWEQVFLLGQSPEPVVRWLIWHHLYGWLAKGEVTLGLALALSHTMGLARHEQTIEYLVDLAIEVQTVRSCLVACERDPRFTAHGYCVPNHAHLAAGGLAILRARPRMAEILRIVPGSSLVVAPSDRDLAAPEVAEGLAESFGGGGYTALQRAALLQMAWDHVSSALDGRESAFELHASGGVPAWRGRLRRNFDDYSNLANRVAAMLNCDMPPIDLDHLSDVPFAPRRQVTLPADGKG